MYSSSTTDTLKSSSSQKIPGGRLDKISTLELPFENVALYHQSNNYQEDRKALNHKLTSAPVNLSILICQGEAHHQHNLTTGQSNKKMRNGFNRRITKKAK